MKNKKIGIFAKTFFYTIFLIMAIIVVTLAVFSKQVIEFYDVSKHQKVKETFVEFQKQLEGKSYDEVRMIAEQFHLNNISFEFALHDHKGTMLYTTPKCTDILEPDEEGWVMRDQGDLDMNLANFNPADKELGLLAFYPDFGPAYLDFFKMSAVVLVFVLMISSIGTVFFAKIITDPIKKLAKDTHKMSKLEPVSYIATRHDEIGQLTDDVHKMYQNLKATITNLELEMERTKHMEESQRYFFSAASHELKTPIAASNALLEGMIENIGDYKNHNKYLIECMKLMNTQTKLVNEILDIVKLTDCKIKPQYEKVNLHEVITEILPPYLALTQQKSQRLEVNIPLSSNCIVDKKIFSRAFSNILINGIQNTKEDESIVIWFEDRAESVKLNILNTGVNIEEWVMEKLFEPFYRMDNARSRKDGHSGLGLTIVKRLLDSVEVPFAICNTKEGVLFWMELSKAE